MLLTHALVRLLYQVEFEKVEPSMAWLGCDKEGTQAG